MPQILAFGDSGTYGAWDKKGGWVQRLREFMDQKGLENRDYYDLVYNLGISGDTSKDVLDRFLDEAERRLDKGEEIIFIFQLGINDSAFRHRVNRNNVSAEAFQKNVAKTIKQAQRFDAKIIILGPIPVDERKVDPIPWAPDLAYRNEFITEYNERLRSFCSRDKKILFVNAFRIFAAEKNYRKFLFDGVHLNSRGHKKLFEIVQDCLVQQKLI